MIKSKYRYLLMTILMLFNFATLILFLFGPIEYVKANKYSTSFFVFFSLSIFIIGFLLSINKKSCYGKIGNTKKEFSNRVFYFVYFLLFITTLIKFINNSHLNEISFNSIILNFKNAILSPKDAYYKTGGIYIGGKLFTYVGVILSPLIYMFETYSLYNFNKKNVVQKILIILFYILEISSWIVIGTNKGIVDLVILFFIVYLIKIMKGDKKINFLKTGLYSVFLVVIVFTIFSFIIGSRTVGNLILDPNFFKIIDNNFILKIFPENLRYLVIYFVSYLTQGYNGLSLCMQLPQHFSYGFLHSNVLISNFSEIFNTNFIENTLQYKAFLEFGWHNTVQWHSIYSWYANDTTIYLVPLIMLFKGLLFGRVVYSLLNSNNLYSIPLTFLLSLETFYFPMNYQIGNYTSTQLSFIIILVLWFYNEYRYKRYEY